MIDAILATLRDEFSDIPDVGQLTRITVRLLLAAALGGLLGYQREQHGKAAGMRTHMLISIGAALFVLVPQQGGMHLTDLSRVLQGVIAGIGFLGAGAILKLTDEEQVHGLTSAAGIWMTAAIGVACGLGREATAVISTLLAFAILEWGPKVVRKRKKHLVSNGGGSGAGNGNGNGNGSGTGAGTGSGTGRDAAGPTHRGTTPSQFD